MARGGARDDLGAWVLATFPGATAYAASLPRDREAAEDVVQECYCRLLEKADVYDLPRDGAKILYRGVVRATPTADQRRSGAGVVGGAPPTGPRGMCRVGTAHHPRPG